MSTDQNCPSPARLTELLNDTLSDEEQSRIEEHIGLCSQCRARIERLAIGGTWAPGNSAAAEALGPHDTALEELKERLKKKQAAATTVGESPSDEGISLDFLAPSETSNSLGRIGIYDILGVIGAGGMGVVLKGHDPRLNRIVAIKVLSPQLASNANARNRFLREAQKAAAVAHEHVVAIHAVDEQDNLPYIVMEYIVGVSLDERIKRTGSLKTEEILRIGMQAARGLAAAHAQGLVHRDVKPSNILLENGVERVKLADFGLARAVDDTEITGEGVVIGTPQYMSPEQARGETVDQRGDLFGLGCVMYAMCTGRSPFRARTVVEAIRRVCDDAPRPIQELRTDIPAWLIDTINGLLEKDPEKRLQTAAELADLLEQQLALLQQNGAGSQLPVAALRPGSSMPSSANRKSKHRWYWVAACGLILLLASAAYMGSGVLYPPAKGLGDARVPPSEPTDPDPVTQYLATLSGIDVEQAASLLHSLPDHPNDISQFKQLERKFWWNKVYEFARDGSDELSGTACAVARAWPGRVGSRYLENLGKTCRKEGLHTTADLFFVASSDESRLNLDMREVMWKAVYRGRVRRDLRDFEGAERCVSEAIEIIERHSPSWFFKNKLAGDDVALHYTRATLLHLLDRSEESQAEFAYVARKIEECNAARVKIWWRDGTLDDWCVFLDACLMSGSMEPGLVIERLSGQSHWWVLPVMVKAYLLQGDVEAAIQNYTTAALSELHQTELTLDACERDLLCVVLANPSHLTSVRRVFEDLVQLQQETLAPLHPRRSFTKLRLAQILIQQGDDLERAEVLLNEALDALQSQSLVPPAVTEEITNLLATVEEMQSEPAPQQSAA